MTVYVCVCVFEKCNTREVKDRMKYNTYKCVNEYDYKTYIRVSIVHTTLCTVISCTVVTVQTPTSVN